MKGRGEPKLELHTEIEGCLTQNNPQCEEIPPRTNVTLMRCDSPVPQSPIKKTIKRLLEPNQKPIRSSGLDCGDLDPFVQSDSFVYLAVSARPGYQGEVTRVKEVPTDKNQNSKEQHLDSLKTHFQSNTEEDSKPSHLTPQKPEEGDFLCTDSFVYLAAPACLLLGPAGSTPYSGRYVFLCVHSNLAVCNLKQTTKLNNFYCTILNVWAAALLCDRSAHIKVALYCG